MKIIWLWLQNCWEICLTRFGSEHRLLLIVKAAKPPTQSPSGLLFVREILQSQVLRDAVSTSMQHAMLCYNDLSKKAPQQLDGLPTVLGHNSCVCVKSALAMLLTCCFLFLIVLDGWPERITSTILASWNTSRAWSTARLIDCCSELKSVPNACQLPLGLQSTWRWCLKHHLEMRSWLLSRLHLSCLHSFKLTDEEKNELP